MRLAACLLLALSLGSCTPLSPVRIAMPEAIRHGGGLYQPWTNRHEAEATELAECLGTKATRPRPTLWVSAVPMTQRGRPVLAYYDPIANAIVFGPEVTRPDWYWLVFRHEMVHHVTQKGNDDPVFRRAVPCRFWPVP